jgi:hypothetical protein
MIRKFSSHYGIGSSLKGTIEAVERFEKVLSAEM